MTGVVPEAGSYLSEFSRLESRSASNGRSWIGPVRRAAISRFAELGFPTTRHEEWKYTSVAPIVKTSFKRADPGLERLRSGIVRGVSVQGWAPSEVVFVNGRCAPELSSVSDLEEGLVVRALGEAIESDREGLEPHLAHYASYQDHPFTALNTAFMEDGAYVRVEPNRAIERPVHLLFLSVPGKLPGISHPRNLVVVGDNSQVTIVESYRGLGEGVYFTNAVTEVVIGENAIVDYYRVEAEGRGAFHIATLQVKQSRSSSFSTYSFLTGGSLVRDNINVVLDGEGVSCTLNGLYLVTEQQHVDNHTTIDHMKPHGTSRELYKGILDQRGTGVFNGKIVVQKEAQKTDARQTNRNLLLSEDAEINSKPQLEILANDVKCSHGSTVGQLDEEGLFYLRSRGLDREMASHLLTYAFAADILAQVRIEPMRRELERLFLGRFRDLPDPGEVNR